MIFGVFLSWPLALAALAVWALVRYWPVTLAGLAAGVGWLLVTGDVSLGSVLLLLGWGLGLAVVAAPFLVVERWASDRLERVVSRWTGDRGRVAVV